MTSSSGPPARSISRNPHVQTIGLIVVLLIVFVGIIWWLKPEGNPLEGAKLYVVPDSQSAIAAKELARTGPASDAKAMANLAAQPSAVWLNGGTPEEVLNRTRQLAEQAAAANTVLTVVAYNLPGRDCQPSGANATLSDDDYRSWLLSVYQGLNLSQIYRPGTTEPLYPDFRTIIIYEPDGVAHTVGSQACLEGEEAVHRLRLEAESIRKLKSIPGAIVYLDAGNPGWFSDPAVIVQPLKDAGADLADGLAINVSNFMTAADSLEYGRRLSDALGGKHFVIDTSRNGAGPYLESTDAVADPTWCNPPKIAAGQLPSTETDEPGLDAYLWIKHLGESDGACRPGEPEAGVWMQEYALDALRASKL